MFILPLFFVFYSLFVCFLVVFFFPYYFCPCGAFLFIEVARYNDVFLFKNWLAILTEFETAIPLCFHQENVPPQYPLALSGNLCFTSENHCLLYLRQQFHSQLNVSVTPDYVPELWTLYFPVVLLCVHIAIRVKGEGHDSSLRLQDVCNFWEFLHPRNSMTQFSHPAFNVNDLAWFFTRTLACPL